MRRPAGMVAAPTTSLPDASGRAQLGLSLLLAARRDADAARAHECRLLRRGADVARLAVARRCRQPGSDADHVWPRRRAAIVRMGTAVAAGIRKFAPGAGRQCRAWAVSARRLWRIPRRDAPGASGRIGTNEYRLGPATRFSNISNTSGATRTMASGRFAADASISPIPRSWPGSHSTAPSRARSSTIGGSGRALARGPRRIHSDVCVQGFDAELGSFVRTYGSKELDASLLLLPVVGFLPPDDPRIFGTVEVIERTLMHDGLVLRYDTAKADDGLPAGEGLFLACSFWLVDAYLMLGRRDDAVRLFERLLSLRNDLGLLSEQYEPRARRLVGNFPQAFSHLALVNAASNLAHHRKPAEQRSHARVDDKAKTPASASRSQAILLTAALRVRKSSRSGRRMAASCRETLSAYRSSHLSRSSRPHSGATRSLQQARLPGAASLHRRTALLHGVGKRRA